MVYGIRIKDTSGNILLLTPEISYIQSSGRVTMSNSLNDDDTYGTDIDLPGTISYGETSLGALVGSFRINIDLTLYNLNYNGHYAQSWFLNNASTFYTRNESTSVMTTFTPDKSAATAYDGVLSVYPRAFFDKIGATTFTAVRLFAATCYEAYDQSATAFVKVYTIGSQGVEKSDYAVYLSRFTE
jgi:hypothetical protein